MQTLIRLALPLIVLGLVSACNTIEGAGQDLQDAGKAVSHEARKTEAGM